MSLVKTLLEKFDAGVGLEGNEGNRVKRFGAVDGNDILYFWVPAVRIHKIPGLEDFRSHVHDVDQTAFAFIDASSHCQFALRLLWMATALKDTVRVGFHSQDIGYRIGRI